MIYKIINDENICACMWVCLYVCVHTQRYFLFQDINGVHVFVKFYQAKYAPHGT